MALLLIGIGLYNKRYKALYLLSFSNRADDENENKVYQSEAHMDIFTSLKEAELFGVSSTYTNNNNTYPMKVFNKRIYKIKGKFIKVVSND